MKSTMSRAAAIQSTPELDEPAAQSAASLDASTGADQAIPEPLAASPATAAPPPFGNDVRPRPEPRGIDSLDAQLAGVADDLLEEDGHSGDDDESYLSPMPAVAAWDPDVYRPRRQSAGSPQDGEPAESDTSALRTETDAAHSHKDTSPLRAQTDAPAASAPRQLAVAADRLAGSLHTVLARASAPLAESPPQVRSAVGWAAAFNIILAVTVWTYALFVMSPERPPPRPSAYSSEAAPAKPTSKGKTADPAKSRSGSH
jgi:hypothetical protein